MQQQLKIPLILLLITLSFQCCKNMPESESLQTYERPKADIENLPDNAAGDLIRRSIESSGGWDKWQEKKTLTYNKIIQSFDSAGNKVREVTQLHQYRLNPSFQARISWEADGNEYVIINNGSEAAKFINGKRSHAQGDINQAWNSSFGSHYVMSMPFKLTDPGVILQYNGLDSLPNSKNDAMVQVDYEPGAGSAGGMHTWYYYFNPEDGALVANFLDYRDGYSYTEYSEFAEVGGIKLSKKRKSYPATAERKIRPVSTVYTNEQIIFDEELGEELFSLE
jgi:hypothetical protein